MDAVHKADPLQNGVFRMVPSQEKQGTGMPIVQMDHIHLAKGPLFDGFRHPGANNEIFDGIGKKGFLGIVVVDIRDIPGLDLRMVQYIMDDVRKFLFGGYLVQFGRIVYAPKAKIQTGHRQAPMVQPGIGWYDHMDLVPPIGYLDRKSTRLNSSHVKSSY